MTDLDSISPPFGPRAGARLAAACLAFAAGCGQHVPLGELANGVGARDGSAPTDAGKTEDGAAGGGGAGGGGAGGRTGGSGGAGGASTLLWKATFEPGDFSEWISDGAGGPIAENISTGPAVTTDVAHGGRYAAKATVMPTMGMASSNYLYRVAPSPTEAYYGAWYYIPSSVVSVKNWLSIIHTEASRTGDGQNTYARWDLNLYASPLAGGNLVAHLYDYVLIANREEAVPVPVPRDKWVHFEVRMVKSATTTGHIAVWQDDVLIIDDPGVATTPNDWVKWRFGAASDLIDPSPSVIYMDDVTISTTRLGSAAAP
jgi:hypothetical protein